MHDRAKDVHPDLDQGLETRLFAEDLHVPLAESQLLPERATLGEGIGRERHAEPAELGHPVERRRTSRCVRGRSAGRRS